MATQAPTRLTLGGFLSVIVTSTLGTTVISLGGGS